MMLQKQIWAVVEKFQQSQRKREEFQLKQKQNEN